MFMILDIRYYILITQQYECGNSSRCTLLSNRYLVIRPRRWCRSLVVTSLNYSESNIQDIIKMHSEMYKTKVTEMLCLTINMTFSHSSCLRRLQNLQEYSYCCKSYSVHKMLEILRKWLFSKTLLMMSGRCVCISQLLQNNKGQFCEHKGVKCCFWWHLKYRIMSRIY